VREHILISLLLGYLVLVINVGHLFNQPRLLICRSLEHLLAVVIPAIAVSDFLEWILFNCHRHVSLRLDLLRLAVS